MQPILKLGSRGEEVTALQQMLKDAGFFPKSQATTQYFGPITEKALKEYQAARGLKTDGIYGPTTNNVLLGNKDVNDVVTQLRTSGNAALAQQLQTLIDSGDQRAIAVAQGTKNNITITPETLQVNREIADADQAKYYQQLEQKQRGDLDSYLADKLGVYNASMEADKAQVISDKENLDNTEGVRGTWASSARQDRANSLINQYNNKFQQNAAALQTDINDKLRGQEYNFGASNLPKPAFQKTTVGFTNNKPTFSSTSSDVYNPFGFVGRYNAEREANKRAGGTDNLTTQNYNPLF